MANNLGAQRPILALDKTNAKTTTAAVTAEDKSFTFSNGSNTIEVGDHVFLSDSADADNQYLGKCLTSSAAGITTEHGAQASTGASSKLWSPTSYAYFEWGLAERGGFVHTYQPGTALVVSRGGIGYPQKSKDDQEWLRMQMGQAQAADYESLRAFLATDLVSATSACSFAFWDATRGLARVVRGYWQPVGFSEIKEDPFLISFAFSFLVQTEDAYVSS